MLLTAVAFLFIVGGWLPQLKYLTLIDKYMMFSFAFIAAMAAQVTIYNGLDLTPEQELPIMLGNLVVIVGSHFLLILHCFSLRAFEVKKLEKNRREVDKFYQDRAKGERKDEPIAHTFSKGRLVKINDHDYTIYDGIPRTMEDGKKIGWMMPKKT
jgi:hypothetical protein